MDTKILYRAVASDGSVVTRKSHRDYAFAVLVGPSDRSPGWGAWSFSGRRDLAERELSKARAVYVPRGVAVELVPVSA